MPSNAPRNRLEDYVAAYRRAKGDPQTRVRKVAKQLRVKEATVLSSLRTAWGEQRFRREIPIQRKRFSTRNNAEDYGDAYAKVSGNPETRVKRIARRFGVKEATVKSTLRIAWGVRRYEKVFGVKPRPSRIDRKGLVRMLNQNGLWKSGHAIEVVSKELGIERQSLKGKMHRWRIIRGPYVLDE
jgi:hypothetical protein